MKTFLLYLLLISFAANLSTASVYGQQHKPGFKDHSLISKFKQSPRVLDKAYQRQNLPIFSLAEIDALELVTFQDWDGDEWNNSFQVDLAYFGLKVFESNGANWEDEVWKPEYKTLYAYDGDGLESITYKYVNSQGDIDNDYRMLLAYQQSNGKNMIHHIIFQEWEDDSWLNDDRITLHVENGLMTGAYYELWVESAWVSGDERITFYQDNEDLIEITEYFAEEEWVNVYKTIFHSMTVQEFYDMIVLELHSNETVMTSDETDPDFTDQYWNGDDWVNSYRRLTEKSTDNSTGKLLMKTITSQNYQEGWTNSHRDHYEYDDEEDIEYKISSTYQGEWIDYIRDDYLYDSEKVLTTVNQNTMDFMGGFEPSGRILLNWGKISTGSGLKERAITFRLEPAYPNPFNPTTNIPYSMSSAGPVKIQVYDVLGRLVSTLVNANMPAGEHVAKFDAAGMSSGIYMVRFEAPGYQQTRTVTLVK